MQGQTINTSRAWLGYQLDDQTKLPLVVNAIELSPSPRVAWHYTVENFGNGPAIKMLVLEAAETIAPKKIMDGIAAGWCDDARKFATGTMAGANNPGPLGYVLFPKQTYRRSVPSWEGVPQPTDKFLYLFSCVAYLDQFKARHWTRSCVRIGDGKNT
jgi:hypothetical protein